MNLLDHYHAIEATSQKMLLSAQSGYWEEVVECEAACTLMISKLRDLSQIESLSPEARREKTGIMKRILKNDAQIRCLAEPWLEDIDLLMNGRSLVH
jgi:flagellar protein FliT